MFRASGIDYKCDDFDEVRPFLYNFSMIEKR